MRWTERIDIDRPASQVRRAIADEHQLMQWSAWPAATGYTCAVDGDGTSLGSAIVFRDDAGTEQDRQRLTKVAADRVEYRLHNRGPAGRDMTPEVDVRIQALSPTSTRFHLDFRNRVPSPTAAPDRQRRHRPTGPGPARGGPPPAQSPRRAGATDAVDHDAVSPDTHSAPVPDSAWDADEIARARGRVEIFNATRPGGLDGWTMDLQQYDLVRSHILEVLARPTGPDSTVLLQHLVASTQDHLGSHPAFPNGRLRNYCTCTKVDLEARGLVERVPGSSPQRVRLARPGST